MLNRIVTNGFGRSRGAAGRAGPITRGYGGVTGPTPPPPPITEVPRRPKGNGTKDRGTSVIDAIVRARLMSINGIPPSRAVSGFVRVPILMPEQVKVVIEHTSTRRGIDGKVTAVRTRTRR